jgi:hypothetical protein
MVKCANCGGTFEAKAEPPPSHRETPPSTARRNTPPPSSRRPPPTRSDSSRARRRDKEDDLEPCPFCRGRNRFGASRCRHCGEELNEEEDDRPWERGIRRDCEPHRGGLVLTLGIVSIVCGAMAAPFAFCYGVGAVIAAIGLGLGIPAWVMGHRDLARMRQGVKDPQGRGTTQGGWICGIIGTCLNVIMLLLGLAMVIFMVVLIASVATGANNVPPARPVPQQQPVPPPNNPPQRMK